MAVIAGTHVIKTSDIDRDIRLTNFLNQTPLNFNSSAKRESAERLITQQIIRDEIVSGGYRRPPESQALQLEAELLRDRFGGSDPRFFASVTAARWTEEYRPARVAAVADLTLVTQFIEQRDAGIVVTDDDLLTYYGQHGAEYPKKQHRSMPWRSRPGIRPRRRADQSQTPSMNGWTKCARVPSRLSLKPGAFE